MRPRRGSGGRRHAVRRVRRRTVQDGRRRRVVAAVGSRQPRRAGDRCRRPAGALRRRPSESRRGPALVHVGLAQPCDALSQADARRRPARCGEPLLRHRGRVDVEPQRRRTLDAGAWPSRGRTVIPPRSAWRTGSTARLDGRRPCLCDHEPRCDLDAAGSRSRRRRQRPSCRRLRHDRLRRAGRRPRAQRRWWTHLARAASAPAAVSRLDVCDRSARPTGRVRRDVGRSVRVPRWRLHVAAALARPDARRGHHRRP